jgi:S1-C subfamily serine protease
VTPPPSHRQLLLPGLIIILLSIILYQYIAIQELETRLQGVDVRINTITAEVSKRLDNYSAPALRRQPVTNSTDPQAADFSQVTSYALPAIVSIHTDAGIGSGVIIDKRGYVVTNRHVIADTTYGRILMHNNGSYSFHIIKEDADQDLALLQISTDEINADDQNVTYQKMAFSQDRAFSQNTTCSQSESIFPVLEFEDAEKIKQGMMVIALGSPAGLDFTVTNGIISAVDRIADGRTYVQTDVPINPGNSGGPLVDMNGKIVGISTFKTRDYEGLGFAIPSDRVKEFAEKAIAQDQNSITQKVTAQDRKQIAQDQKQISQNQR